MNQCDSSDGGEAQDPKSQQEAGESVGVGEAASGEGAASAYARFKSQLAQRAPQIRDETRSGRP